MSPFARRLAAVLVALALIVGGFALSRWQSKRADRIEARKARQLGKAKRKARGSKNKRKRGQKSKARSKSKSKSKSKAKRADPRSPIRVGDRLEPQTLDRPNVVLIIGCTVRADQLTPYGGHVDATPFLLERANEGALFEHAIAAAPWTKAGSAALVTGHHPASVGMVEPGPTPSRRKLADAVTTLAERFGDAGYQTFGATANPNLNAVFGFAQGFDGYLEGTELWRLGGKAKVHGRSLIDEAMPMIVAMQEPERPFYGQFLFTDAHSPATVKAGEVEPFRDEDLPLRVQQYRAMLHRFDLAVKLLVDALGHRGLTEENTVFVVVSDHGEGLSHPKEHGRGHGNFTFASTIRMPWIVWGAGVEPGHRIGGMASQVDVHPTLVELAGLEASETEGRSWAAQLRGEAGVTTRTEAFADTWFQKARRSGVYTESLQCHADWAGSTTPTACYADDGLQNPAEGPEAEALMAKLVAFRADVEGRYDAFPHTLDATPSDEVAEQLEALGYVEGADGTVPDRATP